MKKKKAKKKALTQKRLRAIEKAIGIVLAGAVEGGDWDDGEDDGLTTDVLEEALEAIRDRFQKK
jgi:hypothetical protein